MQTIHITRYAEIPAIPLLLDQVLLVANEATRAVLRPTADDDEQREGLLTASMVNNYVKRKLVPAPVKRRYEREHVCLLIWICLLKHVMGLDDIEAFFAALSAHGSSLPETYDGFCDDVEALLGTHNAPDLPLDELVLAAAQAVASHVRLLELIAGTRPQGQDMT